MQVIENNTGLKLPQIAQHNGTAFQAQFARLISGQHTEFVFHRFANKWFILITQYGKAANIVSVKLDASVPGSTAGMPVHSADHHVSAPLTIQCHTGADSDELQSAIKYLVNHSQWLSNCPLEMLFSLGLKNINAAVLKEVVAVINEFGETLKSKAT